MSADIAFCPLCAGKLDADEADDQFRCVECESAFLIQPIAGDEDEEDEDDDEDEDEDEDDEDEKEEEDEKDEKDEY